MVTLKLFRDADLDGPTDRHGVCAHRCGATINEHINLAHGNGSNLIDLARLGGGGEGSELVGCGPSRAGDRSARAGRHLAGRPYRSTTTTAAARRRRLFARAAPMNQIIKLIMTGRRRDDQFLVSPEHGAVGAGRPGRSMAPLSSFRWPLAGALTNEARNGAASGRIRGRWPVGGLHRPVTGGARLAPRAAHKTKRGPRSSGRAPPRN
jgi:hypothetical protein